MRTLLLSTSLIFLFLTSYSQYLHFAKILPRVGNFTAGYYTQALSAGTDREKNIYTLGVFSHSIDFDPGPGSQQITPNYSLSIYISKLDSLGNFLWLKTIDGQCHDGLADILVNSDGSFFLAGNSFFHGVGVDLDPGPGTHISSKPGFISKFDRSGNFIWTKELDCGPNKIKSDMTGNLYVTGYFGGTVDFDPGAGVFNMTSQTSYQDIFILKLDTTGNFIWAKQFSSSSQFTNREINIDGSANLYLTGAFKGQFDADPGTGTTYLSPQSPRDFFIVKLDSAGSFVWANSLATFVASTDVDENGNCYIQGNFVNTFDFDLSAGVHNVTAASANDIFYLKLDPSGNFSWVKTLGSLGTAQSVWSMKVDRQGTIFSSGVFTSVVDFDPDPVGYSPLNASFGTSFLLRMDSSGNFKWVKQFGSSTANIGGYLALDAASNVYLAGTISGGTTPVGPINWDPNFSNYTTNDPDNSLFITKYSAVFTPVLNIKEQNSTTVLSIYPNPTERFLWLQKDKSINNTDLHLYNGVGVDLISNILITQMDDKIMLDLSGIPIGTYILTAGKQGSVLIKK
ncbi:MAG TPA: hypothetical protein VL098_09610 [Flavipsychrobacter sp.]|nr:hypothetical protein [Flavipsychrobacter sp.]